MSLFKIKTFDLSGCNSSFIVFKMPNLQQIMANYPSALNTPDMSGEQRKLLVWRPALVDVLLIFLLGYFVLINLHKQSPFLYFQF